MFGLSWQLKHNYEHPVWNDIESFSPICSFVIPTAINRRTFSSRSLDSSRSLIPRGEFEINLNIIYFCQDMTHPENWIN